MRRSRYRRIDDDERPRDHPPHPQLAGWRGWEDLCSLSLSWMIRSGTASTVVSRNRNRRVHHKRKRIDET